MEHINLSMRGPELVVVTLGHDLIPTDKHSANHRIRLYVATSALGQGQSTAHVSVALGIGGAHIVTV